MQVCPACQATNKDMARFCSTCGFELAVPAALPPMTVLQGRYTIVEQIGGGGMSTVYKAFDTRLGNALRAVKEIKVTYQLDPEERTNAIEEFRREAEVLARLDHPNLPKVYDYFLENGRHYLVMDLVEGCDLRWVIDHDPDKLTEGYVLNQVVQLCDVLEHLHSQTPPIIFRDLKPSNIMITRRGTVKLIDFGIARFFEPHREKDTRAMGTPGYAAPEQYGHTQTDARSDIYSLGVVLHELLTLFDPSDTPFNLPRIRDLNPRVSKAVEDVIQRATSLDPNSRFRSVAEFREALFVRKSVIPKIHDYRDANEQEKVLRSLVEKRNIQVWAEAENPSGVGVHLRWQLVPGARLAIWTSPPGPRELQEALALVEPREVYLFAHDPGVNDTTSFARCLGGLVKYALEAYGGRVDLESVAAALAHRIVAVQAGLEWLAAAGQVLIIREDDDSWELAAGTGHSDQQSAEAAFARLEALLAETAAYRAWLARAPLSAIFGRANYRVIG